MNLRQLLTIGAGSLALSLSGIVIAEESRVPYVRIAELEIFPARLENYKASVKEEMQASVRVEPGVLAICSAAETDNPSKLRFFDVYADAAAYKSHRETPHDSRHELADNLAADVSQPEVAALEAVGQLGVVESKQV